MIGLIAKTVSGLKSPIVLIDGDGSLSGEEIRRLLSERMDLHVARPGGREGFVGLFEESRRRILDCAAVDFISGVKILTRGSGFENVLVLSSRPNDVRTAMGIAGVFGRVYLFSPPEGKVCVDLHNTLHYKSLTLRGVASPAGSPPLFPAHHPPPER